MEGTPGRSRKDVAIILYPVAAGHCNYVSCLPHYLESLPRSDDMPVYTISDHIEGIQYGHKKGISLYVKQKLSSMVSGET